MIVKFLSMFGETWPQPHGAMNAPEHFGPQSWNLYDEGQGQTDGYADRNLFLQILFRLGEKYIK